jgi:hypothetical protein
MGSDSGLNSDDTKYHLYLILCIQQDSICCNHIATEKKRSWRTEPTDYYWIRERINSLPL